MFVGAEHWPTIHRALVKDVPQPRELAQETPEVLEQYVRRVRTGFDALKKRLELAQPDVVVVVGDDQNEVFSNAFVPTLAVFIGEAASGTTSISFIGEKQTANHVTLTGHPALARGLVEALVDRGFDPVCMEELKATGRPETGLGHAFTRIGKVMALAERGLPLVPVFINAYHPPLPSAARCYALGQAIRAFFTARPERVVLYGSGGLSHCPVGPRAGWVDEPLDRWVLERIARGEGAQLKNLFTFDSDTLRSGTGEIRSWVTVAGAFDDAKATVVDYIPARHAVTGLGFAYWDAR